MLDRNKSIPLYHQIRDVLRDSLFGGDYRPGKQIPSEKELIAKYGVSRITVKQAINSLVQEGLLYKVRGKGTFVAKPRLEHNLNRLMGFSEQIKERGMHPSNRLLEAEIVAARGEVAEALACRQNSFVTKIKRLRLADGEPMGLQIAYVPVELCDDLIELIEQGDCSLYELFQSRYNLVMSRAIEKYKAIILNPYDASLLNVPSGSAAIYAERITYLVNNHPLEYVVSLLRGDRYELSVELIPGQTRVTAR